MIATGGNRALLPRREGESPSDGEMPWPESLRGDDAERAKGAGARGNNSLKLRWYASGSCKHERRAISTRLSCELTSSSAELRLTDASICRFPLAVSQCLPPVQPEVGRWPRSECGQERAKGGYTVAKEHGNVPSRSWQAVGLALFPVLSGPEAADKLG